MAAGDIDAILVAIDAILVVIDDDAAGERGDKATQTDTTRTRQDNPTLSNGQPFPILFLRQLFQSGQLFSLHATKNCTFSNCLVNSLLKTEFLNDNVWVRRQHLFIIASTALKSSR